MPHLVGRFDDAGEAGYVGVVYEVGDGPLVAEHKVVRVQLGVLLVADVAK